MLFKTYDDLFLDQEKQLSGNNALAREFLQRLKKCVPGRTHWREYQNLITDIFTYLFVPPLRNPKPQSRTNDRLEIRDVVYPNHTTEGFWHDIKNEYSGSYVVVEAKNKQATEAKDVVQIADYLTEKQAGSFGLLISRRVTESALKKRRKYYSNSPHKMSVLLDDEDIKKMLKRKSAGENPEDVIIERIDTYRIDFEF